MSTNPEAARLSIEYYRKQAKALLKALKSGDPTALQRLRAYVSNPGPNLALHDAQLTIAREHGFPSWPSLKAFIVQSALDFRGRVSAIIEAALSDLRPAKELLAAHPEIAEADLYTALVLGNAAKVEQALIDSPDAAKTKGGPRQWEPLLYVCFSRFANQTSDHADDLVTTAQLLLSHGADPSATCIQEEWPDNPLSCLYAAIGLNNNPALAEALLKAGAQPNDSESLYHSTEHPGLACMKLLLQYGASPSATNALKHMLDREDIEGARLLLEAGADPNETNQQKQTALHWAVWRARSAPIIALLVDKGADLNAKRNDGRTAYALAIRTGQSEVAALLASRGAQTDLSEVDRCMGLIATADPTDLAHLQSELKRITISPHSSRLIPDLAMSGHTSAVRALLAAGLPVDARGDMGGTALHWACWKGYPDLVKLLIEHHASFTIEDHSFHGTPPGWFGHGVQNNPEGRSAYPEVARLLIAAGAVIPKVDIPTGNPEVDAVLREHGLITVNSDRVSK